MHLLFDCHALAQLMHAALSVLRASAAGKMELVATGVGYRLPQTHASVCEIKFLRAVQVAPHARLTLYAGHVMATSHTFCATTVA